MTKDAFAPSNEDPGCFAAKAPLTVYFDGSCALCSVEIGHYSGQKGSETLHFVDASTQEAQTGGDLTRDAALKRFHVRRPDGELLSGAKAFVAIWETLPAWGVAARLARLPGMIPLLEVGYRLFLPLRPLLSRAAAALGARPHRRSASTSDAVPMPRAQDR